MRLIDGAIIAATAGAAYLFYKLTVTPPNTCPFSGKKAGEGQCPASRMGCFQSKESKEEKAKVLPACPLAPRTSRVTPCFQVLGSRACTPCFVWQDALLA